MIFERGLKNIALYTTRRLSRYRAVTVLTIYALIALVVAFLSYAVTFNLVLYPLASLSFKITGRTEARHVSRTWNQPTGIASFAIGAIPSNRTAELEARRRYLNYGSLPMRRPEVDLILSYLRSTDTYLEYGASGTTLAFPMLVKRAFVIEHDVEVCNGISSEMQKHPELGERLRAFCAPVPPGRADWGLKSQFEEGSYRAFHNYVDFPRMNMSDIKFDKVLINGRARIACALRILPQLRVESLVFFHDYFYRPEHYSQVLGYYDEVARIIAHGPVTGYTDDPMGLLVLKPKREYVEEKSDVSVARINAIYDAYHEIEPTEKSTSAEVAFQHSLANTQEGGFPYYERSRALRRKTSRVRILLDLIAIPFIVITYLLLRAIFVKIFLEALSSSSSRSTRLLAGDIRAAVPWASRNGNNTSKPQPKPIPAPVTTKSQDSNSSAPGKAE